MDGWTLDRGIDDLATGSFTHLQDLGDRAPSEDGPFLKQRAQEAAAAAHQSAKKALDYQTVLLSLSNKGPMEICAEHLSLFDLPMTQDVYTIINDASRGSGASPVRDFKRELFKLEQAYESLAERFIEIATRESQHLESHDKKDIRAAEMAANHFYAWARTYFRNDYDDHVGIDKAGKDRAGKLMQMPYLVAMAYATRVRLDVHYVESSMMDRADRMKYLERSTKAVDDFAALLRVAVDAILAKSSLLEVALDYHWALKTYMTLLLALRKSEKMMLAPTDSPRTAGPWDDGLSGIRATLLRGKLENAYSAETVDISLTRQSESSWWARFSDEHYQDLQTNCFRNKIALREVLFILGADSDNGLLSDDDARTLSLAEDYKHTLTQLPPARSLRSTFRDRLVDAFNACQPPYTLPEAFVRICNVPTRTQTEFYHAFDDHSDRVCGLALTADGDKVVSGSWDGSARVWDLATREELCTFTCHKKVRSGRSSVVAKKWGTSVAWLTGFFHSSPVGLNCVTLCRDGKRVVSGGEDKTVRVWSIDSGDEHHDLKGHGSAVRAVAVSPSHQSSILASASGDKTVKLWNYLEGKELATFKGHKGSVQSLAFSGDGETLASGSKDKTIRIWNVRNKPPKFPVLCGHSKTVSGVAFTPDGHHLVSSSLDETIKVWNWRTGEEKWTFTDHVRGIKCLVMFPKGNRIASGSADKTVRIWNLQSLVLEETLERHTDSVMALAVSKDGQTLASGGRDNKIIIWKLGRDELE